uniref:Uncharacterized protein n=1 Tax=Candidatus Kentrum sp. LPFa TaxID=2126335 RepID=A0A450VY16_9GAMM|nr:MAG: hypothetical protein BECKLPF1236A_GA0070988_1002615 [Candidatus Kentron sp. LPFa]VFK33347.1 MAG: hypothetical protein BECKLPF1236C_GA0070990_102025 [Candidatus Kentron sp. LPFa]
MDTLNIGVVEIPDLGLIDPEGRDWLTHDTRGATLLSKQVLLSGLQAAGFDTQMMKTACYASKKRFGIFMKIW